MADRAVVVDTRDPRSLGRIKVLIPSRMGSNTTDWIWPIGGSKSISLPQPGSQVFVLYEADDPDYPVWLPILDPISTEVEFLKTRIDRNPQEGPYTLVISDAGKLVEMGSSSAQALTVPTNASVPFPVGTKVDVLQTGSGECTISGDVGVTVNSEGSKLKINAQWQAVTLVKRDTDEWVAIGALKS